jgi:hypothetical protein
MSETEGTSLNTLCSVFVVSSYAPINGDAAAVRPENWDFYASVYFYYRFLNRGRTPDVDAAAYEAFLRETEESFVRDYPSFYEELNDLTNALEETGVGEDKASAFWLGAKIAGKKAGDLVPNDVKLGHALATSIKNFVENIGDKIKIG